MVVAVLESRFRLIPTMPYDRRSIAIEGDPVPQCSSTIYFYRAATVYSWLAALFQPRWTPSSGLRGWGGGEKVAARKYERLACHPSSSVTFRLPNIRLDKVAACCHISVVPSPVVPFSSCSKRPLPVAGNELFIANRIPWIPLVTDK